MDVEIFMTVLLVFMALGAIIAVETRNLLSSVISLGAIGFGMSIAFLFLRAPDLAIVQIAVEVLLLVFLIRATIRRDVVAERGHVGWPGLLIVTALAVVVFAFGVFAFEELGAFGEPAMATVEGAVANEYLQEGLSQTGAANIVTAVLLDFRAYDTLGEATVLFTALIGAAAILRGRARREAHK
jgi:multisubunit Na+/H+ antiporter MnhB subunit